MTTFAKTPNTKAGTTTAGTGPAALPVFPATQVMLQAPAANTATIKFGDATSRPMELAAGATLIVPVTDLSDLHVSAASDQALHWWACH